MGRELGQLQKEAWGAFLIGHASITRKIDKILVSRGFVCLQVYDVLLALEDSPEKKMRMTDLAEAVVFDPSSVTRLIDRLEKLNYVRREAHPTDGRSTFAVLTEMGLAERERAWPTYRQLIQEHFGRFLTDSTASKMATSLYEAVGQNPRAATTEAIRQTR